MKALHILALSAVATPLWAQDTRQLDAHEHGVGTLDIAIDGALVAMEFHAPGADIVGFEYQAERAEDKAAIDAAIATLMQPLELFTVPAAAGCAVTLAKAELETEGAHEDHDDHAHDEHGDDDHADHDEHAHDDHGDDDHAHDDHAHDDHADHADGSGHTEFHAEYAMTCADTSALTSISFPYFDMFPNALEVEVQLISDAGATAFEVTRDDPTLDLSGVN